MVRNSATSSRTIIRASRPSTTFLNPEGTTPHAQSREIILFLYRRPMPAGDSPVQAKASGFVLTQIEVGNSSGTGRIKPLQTAASIDWRPRDPAGSPRQVVAPPPDKPAPV